MSIIAILQARMGSTRLPGKVLKKICGKPLLYYTTTRLKKSKMLDKIILATSANKENDAIEQYCRENNITCFRGKEDDVLDRYYQCARKYDGKIIVRITGDCPLIDPNIVDKVIKYYMENDYDYIKNTWFKNAYPSGFDVEVFGFDVLEKHCKLEKDIKNREHVLSTLDDKLFKKIKYSDLTDEFINSLNFDLNNIHLSVDTPYDFKLIEFILNNFKDNINFTFDDIIELLNKNTDFLLTYKE